MHNEREVRQRNLVYAWGLCAHWTRQDQEKLANLIVQEFRVSGRDEENHGAPRARGGGHVDV